jgi:dolichol-phosphate mannosyltransferase
MQTAVIIIPTYNEASNIEKTLTKIFSVILPIAEWDISVLVVESSSPDKTGEIVKSQQARYPKLHLLETPKEGLGKAYLRGFKYALNKLRADVILEMDADLSHDPSDIPRFLREIEKGADFVIGTRYAYGGSIPKDWGLNRKIFSIGANLFIRLGFMKLRQTEWTNGYRAIRRWVVEKIMPHMEGYTGYVFQVAFLDKTIKLGAKISQIPIHFTDRADGVSKINAPQYIIQTFWYVLTNSSFIKFGVVGGIGAIVDFGLAYLLKEVIGTTVLIANMISTESAVLSNYMLNNFWSFQHAKVEHRVASHLRAFAKFNLVSLGNILIQLFGIKAGYFLFGERYWLLYKFIIIACVIVPYSYLLYNRVIWKKKKSQLDTSEKQVLPL